MRALLRASRRSSPPSRAVRRRPPIEGARPKVVLTGPSTRFLSGITYYTHGLAGGLATTCDLSVLLIRRLLPARLYPGHRRVGDDLSGIALPAGVPVLDGLDWFWGPSMVRSVAFLWRQRPDVVILQWWTSAVLHSYVLLGWVARRMGAEVVIEFHESLDSGEAAMPLLNRYVQALAPRLFRSAAAWVVHSEHDRAQLVDTYGLDAGRSTVIPHALYEHLAVGGRRRTAPEGACNLLFFGLIRPVKGLDVLLDAMTLLGAEEAEQYWLTIVGEPWEGCESLLDSARTGPFASRTTVVDRYVSDAEAAEYFAGADLAVLPYRRSSQSGVLHLVMSHGLPVVASAVGGLSEAAERYDAAELVEPDSPLALLEGIRRARTLGRGHPGQMTTWADTGQAYRQVIDRLLEATDSALAGPPMIR